MGLVGGPVARIGAVGHNLTSPPMLPNVSTLSKVDWAREVV